MGIQRFLANTITMVLLILHARGEKRDSFELLVDRAIELWKKIEDELHIFQRIVNIGKKHVDYFDFRKCAGLR